MNLRNTGVAAAGAVALIMATSTVQAADIVPGLYQLGNHPDGNAANPLYGFRLDELFDVTGGHDVFTFDFEAVGAAMFLNYDGNSIHIFGTAFGGLDTGSSYDPANSSLVEIDFTYSVVESVPGDDDVWVTAPDFTNSGTITWLATGEVIDLFDYSGNNGYTFQLGDGVNDNGHRGFDGISGWGWVDHHAPGTHVASSDWLFTAQLVPVPPAVVMGMAGLLGAGILRRRIGKRG